MSKQLDQDMKCPDCGNKLELVGYDSPGECDGFLCILCANRRRRDHRLAIERQLENQQRKGESVP